jgi:hypothetical protein
MFEKKLSKRFQKMNVAGQTHRGMSEHKAQGFDLDISATSSQKNNRLNYSRTVISSCNEGGDELPGLT